MSYRSYRRCASLVLALVISACASSSNPASGRESATTERARGTSTLITRAELEERSGDSAYQAIQALRPRWLRPRAFSIVGGPIYTRVVVDRTLRGGRDELLRLIAANIEDMRYLGAPGATIRYGTGYPGGVIEVTIRSGGR